MYTIYVCVYVYMHIYIYIYAHPLLHAKMQILPIFSIAVIRQRLRKSKNPEIQKSKHPKIQKQLQDSIDVKSFGFFDFLIF